MGTISDCCVAVDSRDLRMDNEGVTNMDTTAMHTYLSTNDKRNNPSIYSKIPENTSSYQSNESNESHESHESNESNESNESYSTDTDNESEQDIQILQSEPSPSPSITQTYKNKTLQTDTQNYLKIGSNDTKLKHMKEPMKRNSDSIKISVQNNKKIQWRIVVTEPLSPIKHLTDNHPYIKHKCKQKLLINGYIRRYNITSITILPTHILNLIFEFYYFHLADYNSQQSVLNNNKKQKQSMKLIIGKHKHEENLSQFLETILKSKLSEKMWNKFDTDLKGVVETDNFTQFLILPVILYKSTLFHRAKKENKKYVKPSLDKKQIKFDIEHLAIWIVCNFGQKQRDNSYHLRLTKTLYQNELAHFIAEYIRIHSV